MKLLMCCIIATLLYLSSGLPLEDRENIHPEILNLSEDHPKRVIDAPIDDVERLRKLDELIGKVELAAMSRISLDVEEELPSIEVGLEQDDAVELLNEGEGLADIAEDLRHASLEKEFSIVALPYTFHRYDLNGDGYITPVELADATGTILEDSISPFRRADTNGDGLLTKKELHRAPWVFDFHRKRGRGHH